MKPWILLITFILYGTYASYAGTIDPKTPDKNHVDYAEKFSYVYKICGTHEDGKLLCGSVVVIDPHWVLSAAHVVKGMRTSVISDKDNAYLIDEIIYHPKYDEDKFGAGDIALCYSSKRIELDFYPSLYETDDEIGKVCCIAGYGLHGNFLSTTLNSDNKKRAGSNKIKAIDAELLMCDASKREQKDFTKLEFLICSGDSGGGLFIDNKVAGINSCIVTLEKTPKNSYDYESGHTRISKYAGWIKETIKNYKKK
jgi:secreted trypsin-like serine protease